MKRMHWRGPAFWTLFALIILITPSAYLGTDYRVFRGEILGDADFSGSVRQRDSLELVAFFKATGGENWRVKWDFSQPMDTWFGVELNEEGCVKCLDLDGMPGCDARKDGGNNLTGALPDLNLPWLEHLFLAGNQLVGNIPDFHYLPSLLTLQLCCNHFSGNIPDFANLPRLNSLELDYNQLSGPIPDFKNLKNLENLYLSNNQLSGSVPAFKQMPNLLRIYLHQNKLTGTLPEWQTPKLKEVLVANNELEGPLPDWSRLSDLQYINVANNHLSGRLPAFQNLTQLRELNLSNNRFEGALPLLVNMPYLRAVFLENNRFSEGSYWTGLPELKACSLAGNQLTFEDLMPCRDWLSLPESYTGQTRLVRDTLIKVRPGDDVVLTPGFDESVFQNHYTWYFEGTPVAAGEAEAHLILEKVTEADMGKYYCVITNPAFPELAIQTRQFILSPDGAPLRPITLAAHDDEFSFDYQHTNQYAFKVTDNDTLEGVLNWDMVVVYPPDAGRLMEQPDGTLVWHTPPGFVGETVFEYELCSLEVEDACDTGMVQLSVRPALAGEVPDVRLPTRFAPEEDRVYIIRDLESHPERFEGARLSIFNQNGQRVYASEPYQNDWRGTTGDSGVVLPAGVYYYRFEWKENGKPQFKAGALTLVRR
ncbi:MAG: hypothetical protein D6714_17685 [Bacteroidetes bacterium]|nr:MAG: hypothetical protein D6714_17685 [Bacteroidota bacterium]